MNTLSISKAIHDYRTAYEGYFGEPAPPVRYIESGSYSVQFKPISRRYTQTDFAKITRQYGRVE